MVNRIPSFLIVVSVAALTTAGWCQESRGTISGRVTDPSGAVISNAVVQVTNQQMGTSMSASAPGFKQYVRKDIQLQVADRLQVNVQLEIGEAQQNVTVSGTPELLGAETASMGNVVTQQEIRDLPLVISASTQANYPRRLQLELKYIF